MIKKGQSEIAGLMIIVIIVTMAVLFYLSYVIINTDTSGDSTRKEFVDNELSVSFVQTLVQLTVPQCNDVTIDVLIKDCGLYERQINCGLQSSCQIIEEVITSVKNQTLDAWDRSYALTVNYGQDHEENIEFIRNDCSPDTIGRRAPGIQPIPYFPQPGSAFVELSICRS